MENKGATTTIQHHNDNEELEETSPFSLQKLSENLESIFVDPTYSDAKIILSSSNKEILIHRCVLSARSPFFKALFASFPSVTSFEWKELAKEYDVRFDSVVAVLGYLYSGRVNGLTKEGGGGGCVDEDCFHVGCRPVVDFMVEIIYVSFAFQVSELVNLYQRHLHDILDKVATDDVLVVLSVAHMCGKACERLLVRCMEIVVHSDVDTVTLDKALPQEIVKQISGFRSDLGLDKPESMNVLDKHVKRIHRALDSDDVELVRMLLREGHTNLDDAHALHYAVAYCDTKTTMELLDLGLADVNHKNPRGYSVLHVAAIRKEPKIIVYLLTKGACPSALTADGRKALQIAKRLSRAADYFKATEEGMASQKDRLCIEILEQAERSDPLLGEASVALAMAGDDLRMRLLYLENRVGLAKLLFPIEAKLVMDIAQVDGTSELPLGGIATQNLVGTQGTTVDSNDARFGIKEEHLIRIRALSKTVELGKRFFPRCSEVLNTIMDADNLTQLANLGNETPEQRVLKKRRYMELQEPLSKAFNEDKEEFDGSTISSVSSSKSSGALPTRSDGKTRP